jgi:ribosomal protein L37AE/L43A
MLFRKKKEIMPEIYSEDFCQSCSEKTKRRYEEGDYVYGSGLQCKKCTSSNTVVTAIYGEYPEENTRARA